MRALAAAGLASAFLATIAVAVWLARDEEERPDPAGLRADTAAAVVQPAPEATIERALSSEGHGSLLGLVQDRAGQPIAGASVQVVVGEATEGLPTTSTDAGGRFELVAVPLRVVAVRVSAPGFAAVQLGDLHAETAPDHRLDLDVLTLAAAAIYHGQVRSAGRGLAGASLVLAPELGPPGQPTPVVQRVVSDAEGWFLFDRAPAPPCRLRVQAEGHREAPVLSITEVQQALQIDLVPLARVRGRVLDVQTGQPLPQARVTVIPLAEPLHEPLRVRSEAGTEAAAGSAVAADGTFDLAAPEEPQFVLEVTEPSHCATALGPFASESPPYEQLVALQPGCVVTGTVRWHGDPIAAMAGLWPVTGATEPVATASVANDGVLLLPPAPPGPWLLRIDAVAGTRFEQRLDLAFPGPPPLAITIADGTRLLGTVRGTRSGPATVVCSHSTGRQHFAFVREDGTFEVLDLFPGRWRAYVLPREGSWQTRAVWSLVGLLDDPGFVVDATPEQRRDLVPAAQLFGRLRGRLLPQFAGSTIELVPSTATQERVPLALRQAVADREGAFGFDSVLPGSWRVRWNTSGQPARELVVEAVPGGETVCTFPN